MPDKMQAGELQKLTLNLQKAVKLLREELEASVKRIEELENAAQRKEAND